MGEWGDTTSRCKHQGQRLPDDDVTDTDTAAIGYSLLVPTVKLLHLGFVLM
jgi:hypothetical protein